jgi:hypothetical protein
LVRHNSLGGGIGAFDSVAEADAGIDAIRL